jgi:hypothetical protein
LLYALCGAVRATVGRFGEWEYKDATGRQGRLAGLQMAFTEALRFTSLLPRWIRAQKCRLLTIGGHTSGGKLLEGI